MKRSKREIPEINTTALPDIIFMLLFFFMVVTVIKKSPANDDLSLPTVKNSVELKADKTKLILHLFTQENDQLLIKIGDSPIKMKYDDQKVKHAIKNKIALDESQIEKVLLLIDSEIPMRKVNKLKRLLQDLELYKVEYLNDKIPASS